MAILIVHAYCGVQFIIRVGYFQQKRTSAIYLPIGKLPHSSPLHDLFDLLVDGSSQKGYYFLYRK